MSEACPGERSYVGLLGGARGRLKRAAKRKLVCEEPLSLGRASGRLASLRRPAHRRER
jgi:hypothetical protein